MKTMRRVIAVVTTVMFLCVITVLNPQSVGLLQKVNAQTSTVSYNNKNYTTSTGSDMAYLKNDTAFDFIGNYNGVWKRVSYNTNGFGTIMSSGGTQYPNININEGQLYNGLKVNVNFIFAKDGSIQVAYNVTNTTGSSKTFSIGSHADVQIGTSDSAPITPFSQKTVDNKLKGFMMNELDTGAQFNFYARGYAGVTAVDSVWYGQYGQRISNIYSDVGAGTNLTGIDSGMAWAWKDRDIPANSSQTYKVKFIIAEKGSENNVASSGTISLIRIGDVQHSFDVYQLMDGSVNEENTYASVMNWGSSIGGYNMIDGTAVTTTAGSTVPLDVLTEFVESDENAEKTSLINRITTGTPIRSGTSVNGSIAFPNLPCGYYLIRDTTVLSGESGDIVSRDLLVYLDDEGRAIELKRAKPSFDKTVATDGMAGVEWAEAADYSIGENFNFKLTAFIPANEDFGGFSQYKLVFSDTYTSGIDFVGINNVTYTVGDGESNAISAESYTADTSAVGSFTLTINNFKVIAGSAWGSPENAIRVDVIYTAKLNKTAPSISQSASDAPYESNSLLVSNNSAYLEYSNNANDDSSLGRTATDYVGVFTYKMLNVKYGNFATDGYQLDGAEFKLYRNTISTENEVALIYDEDMHAYRPVLDAETGQTMISGYGLGDINYKGRLDIVGIDCGCYIIEETQAPDGYSPIDPMTYTFNAVPEEKSAGTGAINTLTIVNGDEEQGKDGQGGLVSLSNDIIDVISSEKPLPQTGGAGTKALYIIGTTMVLGAGVMLIIKKRLL